MEKIVTSTGIKVEDVKAHNLTVEILKEKLKAGGCAKEAKKADLPVGRFVAADDGGFVIYTVEERDIDAEYALLDEKAKRVVWSDGFKRKMVNAPNHIEIKEELGLVEKGGRVQKAVDGTKYTIALNMARAGFSLADIIRLSQLPADMAERAIAENIEAERVLKGKTK